MMCTAHLHSSSMQACPLSPCTPPFTTQATLSLCVFPFTMHPPFTMHVPFPMHNPLSPCMSTCMPPQHTCPHTGTPHAHTPHTCTPLSTHTRPCGQNDKHCLPASSFTGVNKLGIKKYRWIYICRGVKWSLTCILW